MNENYQSYFDAIFAAVITDVDFGDLNGASAETTWIYAWTEVNFNNQSGEYAAVEAGRSGSLTQNAAVELNDVQVEIGAIVWIRLRGYTSDGDAIYEMLAPPTGSGIFAAELTDVAIGTIATTSITSPEEIYLYGWREVHLTDSGAYLPVDGGRSGTVTVNPARELNDRLVDLNTIVWMRFSDFINNQATYEFPAPDGSTGGGYGGDYTSHQITGTSPERFYPLGATNGLDISLLAGQYLAGDTLYAIPFWKSNGGTIHRLGQYFYGTGGGGLALYGIYEEIGGGNKLPGNKVYTSSAKDISASVALKFAVNLDIDNDKLYWLVYYTNTFAETVIFTNTPLRTLNVLGNEFDDFGGLGGTASMLTKARTYDGTLPSVFPSNPTFVAGPDIMPVVLVSWAS